MGTLSTKFGGLTLDNPVIIASAPPTETLANIRRCAEAGAGAVVTKTMADFDHTRFELGARRAMVDKRGLWALSTFRRETLTLAQGAELVADAKAAVGIPIIASVGGLDMEAESWVPACKEVERAGASMIQLDLFYVPHPRCSPENVSKLRALIEAVAESVSIPVAPKLNLELPAHYASEVLRDSPISAVFAIDSIRVPTPMDLDRLRPDAPNVTNAGECSLFGPWQKPITLQYVRVLAEHMPINVCAGGGLMTGADAVEAIALGASCVQFATAVIQHGFKRITRIVRELESGLAAAGIESVQDLVGRALNTYATSEEVITFDDVKAAVNVDVCIMCGRCTRQVFCSDIQEAKGRIEVLPTCDGCGLCVAVCPTQPKALSLVPAQDWFLDTRCP